MIPDLDHFYRAKMLSTAPAQPVLPALPQRMREENLLSVLDHDVWNFDIFLGLIFCSDLEYDVVLVTWNRLFANGFKKFAHS